MKTNSELARVAELKVQILLAVEIPNVATSDLMPEVRKIIADTYAEAMAELEILRAKSAMQVVPIVIEKRCAPTWITSDSVTYDKDQCGGKS